MEKGKEILAEEEVRGELVESGQLRLDRQRADVKISRDLTYYFNQQLLPYKLYFRDSSRFFILPLCVDILSIWGISFSFSLEPAIPGLIIFLLSLITVAATSTLLFNTIERHGFFILPLCKLYRARKIFKQIMEELHSDAMNGKIEMNTLEKEFDSRIKRFMAQKKQEEKDRENRTLIEIEQSKLLIKQAKESDL